MSIKYHDQNVAGMLAVDATPASGSTNPVSSGGVYSALADKQNTLTFDSVPTAGSSNPVTSSGIRSALDAKADKNDLATIHQTSPTCTETNGIAAGVFFYLDNELVVAKTAIANGATFTNGTNYESPTAGGLNALKSAMFYRTGDTINISESNQIATWCLILSRTSIAIAVPLDKKCIANGATVTLGTAFIRWPGSTGVYSCPVTVTKVSIDNNGTELIVEGTVSSMSGASANTIGYAGFISGTIMFT